MGLWGERLGALFQGLEAVDLERQIETELLSRSWRVWRSWFKHVLIVARGGSPAIKFRLAGGPGHTVSLFWKPILDVPWSESPFFWNVEGSVRNNENALAFAQRVLLPEIASMFPGRVLLI